jgi:hypothetical protein
MFQSEGAETHGTFSRRFRVHECPVGRSLSRASSRFGDAHLCVFCFAWISCRFRLPALTNRNNPLRAWFPGIPFGRLDTATASRHWVSFRTPPSPRIPLGVRKSLKLAATVRRTGPLDPACLAAGNLEPSVDPPALTGKSSFVLLTFKNRKTGNTVSRN